MCAEVSHTWFGETSENPNQTDKSWSWSMLPCILPMNVCWIIFAMFYGTKFHRIYLVLRIHNACISLLLISYLSYKFENIIWSVELPLHIATNVFKFYERQQIP